MSTPATPKQPKAGAAPTKARRHQHRQHYRKTSAIIDERPDGKPVIFGYGRHMSRREKERLQKRLAYTSLALVVLACVAIIAAVSVYNLFVYPNQTVASVNGSGISRHDRDVMTAYYNAAAAQASAQGSQLQGDPQTLGVEQLQKSLLTKISAAQKLHITASFAEASAQLTKDVGSNTANFTSLLKQYGISRDDYVRLVEEPRVIEQKVGQHLTQNDPKTAPQWHYARMSLKTQAAADAALKQLLKGTAFASLAKKESTDTQTASNGGDMGWQRVTDTGDPLLASTFLPTLTKMQKSGTKYEIVKYSANAWYIVEFLGYDAKHPLSSSQMQADQVTAFNNWIKPIQASAIFNPPLPASTTTTTTGSTTTSGSL